MTTQRSDLQPDAELIGQTDQDTRPSQIPSDSVSSLRRQASRVFRWTKREIILVFFAAFIAGLGAGAAQALISWALE